MCVTNVNNSQHVYVMINSVLALSLRINVFPCFFLLSDSQINNDIKWEVK